MNLDMLSQFVGTCIVINFAFLLVWTLTLKFMADTQYRIVSYFLEVDKKDLAVANLKFIAFYKLATYFFLVVPYIALILL